MLFNSITYLLFMLSFAPMAVFGPRWLRNGVLLLGSIAFYAFWRIDFTGLVVFTAFVDWYGAHRIHASLHAATRRAWLVLSLVMNLSVLCFFKYFTFAIGTSLSVASLIGFDVKISDDFRAFLDNIVLPLGISFYTFHSLSYVFDVYRGAVQPVARFFAFLTYVLFWTQLVAGPILRTAQVVPQIEDYRRPTRGEVVYGLEEIIQGFFKKLVIADQLAPLVDYGYSLPVSELGTLDVWVLAFGFGFQIYFDFSGYSQIALGSARVMGFHFPPNFDWPYLASSPKEFWRRWHISLSSWIRDYLYVPLLGGGFHHRSVTGTVSAFDAELERGKPTEARRTAALFLTWIIMGFWHGANWTFALWGLWHAALIFLHRMLESLTRGVPTTAGRIGGWAVTLPLAMLGWVFFRAQTVPDSIRMVATAFDMSRLSVRVVRENHYLVVFGVLLCMLLVAGVVELMRPEGRFARPWVRYPALAAASGVMLTGVFLTLRQAKSFIYFQF